MANVVLIFKQRDKSVMSHYPPIGLTLVVGKILEYIIARNICGHLKKQNFLHDSAWLHKGKCCLTNLSLLYKEEYRVAISDKFYIIYLKLRKVFDKVPQQRFLCKLKPHGIAGKGLR